jgi:hypothetical protein
MKSSLFILSSLVFVIVALSVIHVVVANMLSTTGVELDDLQTNLTKYKKENIILREDVLGHASLYYIASVAAEMGFVDAKSPIVIHSPLPIAKR